jgi:hypothetical protein
MALPTNPWSRLSRKSPYVLPDDAIVISKPNPSAPNFTLHLELQPEPFIGLANAPVVLLKLNPGFDDGDPLHHQDEYFYDLCRANLSHSAKPYSFFFLDPALTAPGALWWNRNLSSLLSDERLGNSSVERRTNVSNGVLNVEFFPYHSRKFRRWKRLIPSQTYSVALVREAMAREAVILMRGKPHWLSVIPELSTYPFAFEPNSHQVAAISPGNFPVGYEAAVEALRSNGS